MIRLIRRGQPREFLRMSFPVKVSAVYDCPAHAGGMAVHVLGGRVRHNVSSPLERPAVNGRCKRIVNDKRHSVSVSCVREFFKIENNKRRIRDRLTEHCLCIVSERRFQFILAAVRIYERGFHAHLPDRMCIEVVCTAVESRRAYNMVSCLRNIHDGIKVRRLSG